MKGKSFVVLLLTMMFLMAGTVHAGNLVIKGSTTVLPIAQKVAEAYMKENPDVKISISGGGSGNGIKALIDGTTDIADSSRFIKDKEVALAVEKGRYPVPFAVSYDCIVPVVHPSNSMKNITLDQLKDVYLGKIKSAEIAQLQEQLDALLIDSTEEHPMVKKLQDQISMMKADLDKRDLDYTETETISTQSTSPLISEIKKALEGIEGVQVPTVKTVYPGKEMAKVMLIEQLDKVMARDVAAALPETVRLTEIFEADRDQLRARGESLDALYVDGESFRPDGPPPSRADLEEALAARYRERTSS